MTVENVLVLSSGARKGKRACRACNAERQRQWNAAQRKANAVKRGMRFAACRAQGADRETLAWLAGLFEGEGTITLIARRDSFTHLLVSVTSTDFEVVERFNAVWPVRRLHRKAGTATAKPAWVWRMTSMKAAAFVTDILPFLRTARVEAKARLALQSQAARLPGAQRPDQYRETQMGFLREMRRLNHRGPASGAAP